MLVALAETGHVHHSRAQRWFDTEREGRWGVCPLTESGFIRLTTNPGFRPGPRTVGLAITLLQSIRTDPDYWYCGIEKSWVELTARFARRIVGHQQITDAYLLGLAIDTGATLVTFDRAIEQIAGPEFSHLVLVLD